MPVLASIIAYTVGYVLNKGERNKICINIMDLCKTKKKTSHCSCTKGAVAPIAIVISFLIIIILPPYLESMAALFVTEYS